MPLPWKDEIYESPQLKVISPSDVCFLSCIPTNVANHHPEGKKASVQYTTIEFKQTTDFCNK
jgi:hypothetical protein